MNHKVDCLKGISFVDVLLFWNVKRRGVTLNLIYNNRLLNLPTHIIPWDPIQKFINFNSAPFRAHTLLPSTQFAFDIIEDPI